MKKFLVLILSILYISTSSGAAINLHYCMGKLVDISLFSQHEDACPKCGMEKQETSKNNCCADEQKQLKAQDDQKVVNTYVFNSLKIDAAIPVAFYELPEIVINRRDVATPFGNAPPRSRSQEIYLLHCNFRI